MVISFNSPSFPCDSDLATDSVRRSISSKLYVPYRPSRMPAFFPRFHVPLTSHSPINPVRMDVEGTESRQTCSARESRNKHGRRTAEDLELAKEKNLVVLEACHHRSVPSIELTYDVIRSLIVARNVHRFHPVMQRMKEILDSGVIGKLKGVGAKFGLPRRMTKKANVTLRGPEMGAGAMMAVGCKSYLLSFLPF